MLLQEKVDNLKKSRITRLNWDNATVGLRVSLFNLETDLFEHFDFHIKHIKDKTVRAFLTSREFEIVELIESDGNLMTADEASGEVVVREFKDENAAMRVLQPMMKLYEQIGGSS